MPAATVEPDFGSVPVACPVLKSCEGSITTRTCRCLWRNSFLAADSLSPSTDGIVVLPSPSDTLRVTVEPLSAFWPSLGDSETTIPGV